MAVARVRMFAGPNGSGKSELIGRLQDSNLSLGPIVNADQILVNLKNSGFIDLKDFEISKLARVCNSCRRRMRRPEYENYQHHQKKPLAHWERAKRQIPHQHKKQSKTQIPSCHQNLKQSRVTNSH